MNNIQLDSTHAIKIKLDKPAAIDAFFLFGIHKCGSSLLNSIFVDICRVNDIPDFPLPEMAFEQGIPTEAWDNCTAFNSIIEDGYCYRGYRHFPLFLAKNNLIHQRKKILLVRDPRDAIVSSYFSFAKSHLLPKSGDLLQRMLATRETMKDIELENYAVARATSVKAAFNLYYENLRNDDFLRVYRYEDIIFEKENWIADMLDFVGLTLRPVQLQRIANSHNVIPTIEDSSKHIRKVKPGDHQEKLSSGCITKLNEILAEVLDRYNYHH